MMLASYVTISLLHKDLDNPLAPANSWQDGQRVTDAEPKELDAAVSQEQRTLRGGALPCH